MSATIQSFVNSKEDQQAWIGLSVNIGKMANVERMFVDDKESEDKGVRSPQLFHELKEGDDEQTAPIC